jgi:hypothetical protein
MKASWIRQTTVHRGCALSWVADHLNGAEAGGSARTLDAMGTGTS